MSASLVPIIVTDSIASPDGSAPPPGTVQFQLTDEIVLPQECAAKVIGASYVGGLLRQELVANDLDSNGDPISPATTMYRCEQNMDGATPRAFFVTVPAVPPGSRVVTDAVTTTGSPLVTSATADFTDDDFDAYVLLDNGLVVPAGTTIATVVNSTTISLSWTPQAALTGATLMIGASVALSVLRPPA